MRALPRSPRQATVALLGALLAAQGLLFFAASLFRVPLGPPERARPGRTIQAVAAPGAWRTELELDATRILVITDGKRLGLPEVGSDTDGRGGRPSHYRYEAGARMLALSCDATLPCRTALIVPLPFRVALDTAVDRLPLSTAAAGLTIAALLAALALLGVAARHSRRREWAIGGVLFGCVYAVGFSPRVFSSEFAGWLVLAAGAAVALPLGIRGLRQRVPAFVWADLVLWRPRGHARPAKWRIATATLLFGAVAAAAISVDALAPPSWERLVPDGHRDTSLEMALNRVLCGHASRVSEGVHVAAHLREHPELASAPLRDVAALSAGSLEAYCRAAAVPLVNNENSLMFAMAGLLRAQPGLSLRRLGWQLQAARLLALAAFACVLVESGASLLLAGAVLAATLCIVGDLGGRYYSVYPFVPVLLALFVAGLLLCLRTRVPERRLLHPAAACLAGFVAAFAVNMRSSHLPLYAALLMLYLWAAARHVRRRRSWRLRDQLVWAGLGAGSAALGYVLFGVLLVRPLNAELRAPGAAGLPAPSYHGVAHPLVLGLAQPENSISIREGITWSDSLGEEIARRVDPDVQFLGRGYETALSRYYLSLWERYPAEMRDVYAVKLWHAGADMISVVSERPDIFVGGSFLRAVMLPLSWVDNGFTLLTLYLTAALAAVIALARTGSPAALLVSLFAATASLLHVETAAIVPFFHMSHHSSQLLCHVVLCAAAWQLAIEGVRLASRRCRSAVPAISGAAAR